MKQCSSVLIILYKNRQRGSEEVSGGEGLPCIHKDFSLILEPQAKVVAQACDPRARKGMSGGYDDTLGLSGGPASLIAECKVKERPCTKGATWCCQGRNQRLLSGLYTHVHIHVHTQEHTH